MNTQSDAGLDAGPLDAGYDAGKPPKPRKDAGMDAGMDAGIDSGPELEAGYPEDAYISKPFDAGPPPPEWVCPESYWIDRICDCGCGAFDAWDCQLNSCETPGCVLATCSACFEVGGAWKPCTPEPDLLDWTCGDSAYNDVNCDCGCGIADPACRGMGCSEANCWSAGCDLRHDETGALDVVFGNSPPGGWTCPSERWGGGDGCDCGCGAQDPDCPYNIEDCTTPLCFTNECTVCHDKTGRTVQCARDLADNKWKCDPKHYAADDGCQCGCGVRDPDCDAQWPIGPGCETQGCRVDVGDAGPEQCERCTDLSLAADELIGCTPEAPAPQWTCKPQHYGTGDGCDCGCGIHDPDCGEAENGCTASGCKDDGLCDYCHRGPSDSLGDYKLCKPTSTTGWSCGTTSEPAWANAECDCGCGKPDPYCRIVDKKSCTAPDCASPICDFCNGAGPRATCTGDRWKLTGQCSAAAYGDGECDCGCGAIDIDCEQDKGCKDMSCPAGGCEVCHATGGDARRELCHEWHCAPELFYDGTTCDCGCGLEDPDCSKLGCTEPGCNNTSCEACYDPAGRQTLACP